MNLQFPLIYEKTNSLFSRLKILELDRGKFFSTPSSVQRAEWNHFTNDPTVENNKKYLSLGNSNHLK